MRNLKRAVGVSFGLFVLILIAGALLGSGGDTHGKAASKAPRAATDRCTSVPPALVDQIATFIKPETGATLRGAQAVRSKDYQQLWFVAADLEGPGLDGDDQIVLVPIAQLTAGDGHLFGVGGFAKEFTDLRRGEKSSFHFSYTDEGVHEAESCVRAALKA